MRKFVAFLAFCVVSAGLAGPAGAFFLRSRNGIGVAFRDLQVCTDGIQFELLRFDFPVNSNSGRTYPIVGGGLNSEMPTEPVYITTLDPDLEDHPIAVGAGPTADSLLVETYSLTSISNDGLSIVEMDGTVKSTEWVNDRYFWKSTPTAEWSRNLPVGTEIYAYVDEGVDTTDEPSEILTVADCTLFGDPPPSDHPCDQPGAILGTEGNDKIRGTNGDDVICTFGGNDRIFAYGGDDVIYAGAGHDKVHGGNGDDVIYGEAGEDRILGQWGDDEIYGGEDNDRLHGSGGDDIIVGGGGHDMILGGQGHDTITQ